MRKLVVAEQISLDGVIQSPGGPKEDPSGDFRLGGWIVPYADELIGQALQDLLAQPFELLLGRRTYEIFAAYWPRKGADSGSHPSLTGSTACPSTSLRTDPMRLTGRTVMRSRATLQTRYARSNTRTAPTC